MRSQMHKYRIMESVGFGGTTGDDAVQTLTEAGSHGAGDTGGFGMFQSWRLHTFPG